MVRVGVATGAAAAPGCGSGRAGTRPDLCVERSVNESLLPCGDERATCDARLIRAGYRGIMPMLPSHASTSAGHRVMGDSVGRSAKACPPFANTCISAETPALLSAA